MKVLSSIRTIIAFVSHRSRAEREMEEELRSHLQDRADDLERRGVPRPEAERQARIEFGGYQRYKDECREALGTRLLGEFIADARYGIRQLRRSPGFTLVAVITLALGIGANAAIYSVLYRDLLRPLPYPHAQRLVMFGMVVPSIDSRPFLFASSYRELRNMQTPFESMASWRPGVNGCDVGGTPPERMNCARVESTFLPTFGVDPPLGRNFTSEEDRPGAPAVCLISYGLWQTRFGGNPAALGRVISIDEQPTRIIGILPRDFEWPTLARVDLVLPEKLSASEAAGPVLRAYARLKRGVSIAQARAQLQRFVQEFIQSAPPMFRKEIRLGVTSVREDQVGSIRRALWILFGATLALLLIASANVANLLLARREVRQQELAVRAALGAGRWRLLRLQLIESVLLGAGGGSVGACLAFLILRVCIAVAPAGIPRIGQAGLGLPVFVLIAGLSVLSGVLCGLGSLSTRPAGILLPGRSASRRRGRLEAGLVVAQVALSLVLLMAAGLLLDTLRNIENIPIGIDTSHIVSAEINLPAQPATQAGEARQVFERLETRLAALPGVTRVVVTDSLPPGGPERSRPFFVIHVEGRPAFERGTGGLVGWRAVTPGYFRMLDIPIIKGRGFVAADRDPQVNDIILSKTLARRLFSGEDAVGQHVQLTAPGPWYRVVGVAADVKNAGLTRPPDPEYYVVRKNAPDLGLPGAMTPGDLRHAFFLVQTPLAARGIETLVRAAIASVDPTLPATISTLDARVDGLRVEPRFDAVLIGLFAMLGLLLAAIGLYGLVSYSVARRTHEIGIRMALGARREHVLKLIVSQGFRLALIGSAMGLAGALGFTRFLSSLLYGVKATDPLTFVVVSLLLIVVALLACYLPARRATKVDPAVALRHE
jgi:putative ABC transport system permease protein